MKTNTVTELFASLNHREEIKALIPMGYTPGIPVLSSRHDELCAEIPYLRYRMTGKKDRTLIYPARYIVSYVLPEMNMVSFVDLAYTPAADNIDFDKPIGYFRHEAIADLDRQGYNDLRARTLTGLDRLAASLLGEDVEDAGSEGQLARDISRIIEPSLHPLYKSLSPNFFKKFISNG